MSEAMMPFADFVVLTVAERLLTAKGRKDRERLRRKWKASYPNLCSPDIRARLLAKAKEAGK